MSKDSLGLTRGVKLWVMYCEAITTTGKPLSKGESVKGVVINFSGVPTENGLGGVGQSELERALSYIIDQRSSYDTGREFRLYLGELRGLGRALDDAEFAKTLNELEADWNPEYDRHLDMRAIEHIVEQGAQGRDVISIGTKILGMIAERPDLEFVEPLRDFLLVNIAVTATDQVAFERKCQAARRKTENEHLSYIEIQQKVRKDLHKRKKGDENKYPKAYPNLVYSAEKVLESSHIFIDNSNDLNPIGRIILVHSLLQIIVEEYPETAQYLTKFLLPLES